MIRLSLSICYIKSGIYVSQEILVKCPALFVIPAGSQKLKDTLALPIPPILDNPVVGGGE